MEFTQILTVRTFLECVGVNIKGNCFVQQLFRYRFKSRYLSSSKKDEMHGTRKRTICLDFAIFRHNNFLAAKNGEKTQ